MSNRFTRDFRLTIGLGTSKVIIVPPFNVSFSATESSLNKALNKLNVTIPGLQESTRQKLIKYELDREKYFPIQLEIGYQGKLYRAFKGSVRTGELSRSGATFSNALECFDGHPDFTTAFTSKTVKGTTQAVDAILGDMPNTQKGAVTTLQETSRPKVLIGASSHLLATIAEGKEFYIKDEKIFILGEDDVLSSIAPLVSAATGLKGTPQQDHIDTTFQTVLNPTLKIGHLCKLESVTNPAVNGVYRIYQIATEGSYKGTWGQTVTCRKANKTKVIR
jgi:hypothetical protein